MSTKLSLLVFLVVVLMAIAAVSPMPVAGQTSGPYKSTVYIFAPLGWEGTPDAPGSLVHTVKLNVFGTRSGFQEIRVTHVGSGSGMSYPVFTSSGPWATDMELMSVRENQVMGDWYLAPAAGYQNYHQGEFAIRFLAVSSSSPSELKAQGVLQSRRTLAGGTLVTEFSVQVDAVPATVDMRAPAMVVGDVDTVLAVYNPNTVSAQTQLVVYSDQYGEQGFDVYSYTYLPVFQKAVPIEKDKVVLVSLREAMSQAPPVSAGQGVMKPLRDKQGNLLTNGIIRLQSELPVAVQAFRVDGALVTSIGTAVVK